MKKSTAKLLRTAVCIIMTIACFTASCFQVSAVAPPYSKSFNNQEDMLASLKIYCEQFPNVEDYSPYGSLAEEHNGYHLEKKNLILPQITGTEYILAYCSYAESIYGNGVNYTFHEYTNIDANEQFRILIYYYLTEDIAEKRLTKSIPDGIDESYEGETADGTPYYAYSYKDDNGNPCCQYNLTIDDCFVTVKDNSDYQSDRINSFSFKAQEIMLPVFVINEDNSDVGYVENDVNADGEFNINDVTYLQKVLADICDVPAKFKGLELNVFDANGDGNINIQDATAMQKLLAQYG